jgi:hypothetical protein
MKRELMKREEVFERLTPPKGGLADLRARIERGPIFFGMRVSLVAMFATAAVVMAILFSRKPAPNLVEQARARDDGAMVALGLVAAPHETVQISAQDRGTTALVRVPTERSDVAFYWVASTRSAE